jgi:hypothetical protein
MLRADTAAPGGSFPLGQLHQPLGKIGRRKKQPPPEFDWRRQLAALDQISQRSHIAHDAELDQLTRAQIAAAGKARSKKISRIEHRFRVPSPHFPTVPEIAEAL